MKQVGSVAGTCEVWRLSNLSTLLPVAPLLMVLCAAGLGSAAPVHVVIETAAGNIEVAVDVKRAPKTSANFLRYVDAGLYDGGTFHRSVRMDNQPHNDVKIEVIQAAADRSRRSQFFDMIPLERTSVTGLKHRDGTISMARTKPDTARHDFFICIGNQPALDFGGQRNPDGQGFAAFGRVVKGMDVVRKIHQSPVTDQRLTPPIRILRAYRKQ
jgi:peptidyl-prolyl cis-trans isomerase A (cyclophilin A)